MSEVMTKWERRAEIRADTFIEGVVSKQETRPICLAPDSDVSRTVLKVGSGPLIDDGVICRCVDEANTLQWNEARDRALTWYHHERTDWLVQYQFCTTKSRKRPCLLEDDVAVVVRSPKDSWDPKLDYWRCSCQNEIYHMDSWMIHDDSKQDKQFWEYRYTCDKLTCDTGEPCVRHYMDRAASHTVGFRFLCTCPEGHYCPPSKGGKPQAYEADGHDKDIGPYIFGYCIPVPGWDRQPWTQ
ncbi:hypothetical protein LSH36_313g00009 [Paralvinella palmiformis]|uniref:Uncharacterized protein n=1 Tax=Paralvinella palmiformis TaxID=53620 RepID=A0AAD9JH98_9ANNE|nr:hypothetical protein LSH36_313g00009 [Paralvinella palmiformis]